MHGLAFGRTTFLAMLLLCGGLWAGRAARAESVFCPSSDLDRDGDVDQEDFGRFQLCLTGPGSPQENHACAPARLDGDEDVDHDDLMVMIACASGPSVPMRPGRLLISEFMASNSSTITDPEEPDEHPDWIEIYNDDSEPIELGGFYLTNNLDQKALWRIPDGIRIEGGAYLLFWADNEPAQGPRHAGFKLDKDGPAVGLIAADGSTVIDSVSYGTQSANVSWGRLPDISDRWQSFPSATPGQPNLTRPREDKVVITEIMYHPYSPEFTPEPLEEEFVELYNAGPSQVDLSKWRLTEAVDFEFPAGTLLQKGEYLVVAANVAGFQARHPDATRVVGGWQGRLSNDGEAVELVDPVGKRMDIVEYSDQGEWSVRRRGPTDRGHQGWEWHVACDGDGPSLELVNLALPNKYGHNWAPGTIAGGTPGKPNSVASNNIAPIIGNVEQTPVVPHSDEPVTLIAEIIDESTAGLTVEAYYRKDGDPGFAVVAMWDDGAHGDGPAGDGVYGCSLPAQPNGTIIEYYFEARDSANQARQQPAFAMPANQPLTNRLYQVDDAFSPTWTAGSQPIYRILMTEAERAELADIGDSSGDGVSEYDSNAQMNGTFVSLDGEGVKVRFNVGVRNRGKGSRRGPPNNYRINFVHEHPWNSVVEINLNCQYPWLQLLGGKLFEAANLPAGRVKSVQVRVNGKNLAESGRRMFGMYMQLESLNGDFADRAFPDDSRGNVYRCMGFVNNKYADLKYLGLDPAAYRPLYGKETHAEEENWTDLIHLTDVLTNAPTATYDQDVARVVNVDQWVRWFAMETLIGNNETNLGNGTGDDYSMYAGVDDPRFVLIPHDLDTVLGTGNGTPATTTDSIWRASGVANVKRFLERPAIVPRYYQQLRDLMQTVFSADQFGGLADSELGGLVPESEIAALKTFVAARIAYVASQIPAALTVRSDLPQSGGYHRTTLDQAALYGQGNAYDTRSIVVNGLVAEWQPISGTWKLGTSSGTGQARTLVAKESFWRYLDDGSNQGTAWREVTFPAESGWALQQAKFGYGDDGERTRISYVDGQLVKRWTYYFRHTFNPGDLSGVSSLKLRLIRDDGAVVYINGAKMALPQSVDNMPDTYDYQTPASSRVDSGDENTFFEATLSPGVLVANADNVIAVEVHQRDLSSSDLGFDLELLAEGAAPTVTGGVPLVPGVNHVLVQAFDGPNGTGQEIERATIDIWYDNGQMATLSGSLPASRTLDRAGGPWHVTGDLVVPAGVTLTIEPGTTLFFDPGTGLTVRGKLVAQGNPSEHIRFMRTPGATDVWDGVAFSNTLEPNVMSYLDMEYGDKQGHSIEVSYSRLLVDHMTWGGTNITLIEATHPSLVIQNSTFPSISGAELVHGEWLNGSEYLVIQGNTFGTTTGYNDVIDFSGCQRPGPIMQIYNNIFMGGGDDAVDMDGTDAHVEGNIFMHFHKGHGGTSTSNALATGLWSSSNQNSEVTVARNLFYDNDHAMLLKEGCFAQFENNTIVGCTIAVISFDEIERNVEPGKGISMDGNILWNAPLVFENTWAGVQIAVNRCDAPAAVHGYGVGNIDADPQYVNPPDDFRLKPGSPAIGAGMNGLDMGAYVPGGATIGGEPNGITDQASVSLTVAGPGVTHYRYRLRDNGTWGDWSASDRPVGQSLSLSGLQDGHSYAVEVIGRNSAGVLEAEADAAMSKTWVVDLP